MTERVCSVCGSDTTQIKRTRKFKDGPLYEFPYWFRDGLGGWLCKPCKYKKDYSSNYYDRSRITFKDKQIYVDTSPRTGVCNWCRAVMPFDCNITNMHHEEYDESNPLAYTIEICTRWHRRHHNLVK